MTPRPSPTMIFPFVCLCLCIGIQTGWCFSSSSSSSYHLSNNGIVVIGKGTRLPPPLSSSSSRLFLSKLDDSSATSSPIESIQNSMGFIQTKKQEYQKAKSDGFGTKAKNAAINATVGDIIVPLVGNLEMRQSLANRGIYAGVEYEVCSLSIRTKEGREEGGALDVKSLEDISDIDLKKDAIALIKPAYPLRDHLERNDWPVPVKLLEEVPLWISKATYLAGNAVGTLFLSSSLFVTAAVIAFFIRFVGVPSPSMVPTLNPGNIVFVTRSLPIGPFKPKVGDVVFFNTPNELETAVQQFASSAADKQQQQQESGEGGNQIDGIATSTRGKQFLKRVVATPGENVGVKRSEPFVKLSDSRFRFDIVGPYARPEVFPESSWDRPVTKLGRNEYFVAGDNGFRSVDSRVWGPLKEKYIVGVAKWVLWPIQDFGPVKPGQISEITK